MRTPDLSNVDAKDLKTWPAGLKFFGAFVICVCIAVAGWFFLIKKQTEDLERLERKEAELKETFKQKKRLAVNLPAYRKQMEEMRESFDVMLRQLPNKTEVPELLVDITQAGLQRGLEFVLFKPQDKVYKDFYAELPINLKVVGDYHQLAEFVSDLAALPRIVTLGNIDILPEKDNESVLGMTAITNTYHYLDQDEIDKRRAMEEKTAGRGKKKKKKKKK